MAALAAPVAALGWVLLPVAVWHLYFVQELRSAENAERLRVETLREFSAPPADWQRRRLGNLSILAPPIDVIPPACSSGKEICFLDFEGGTISLFQEGYLEPYREMVNLRAPDERDLSVLRFPGDNWATIQALRVRVLTFRSRLDSSRFESGATKGVVARSTREGVERYVVAAYSLDESLSRGVGVSGFSEETFHQILGGLEIFPR